MIIQQYTLLTPLGKYINLVSDKEMKEVEQSFESNNEMLEKMFSAASGTGLSYFTFEYIPEATMFADMPVQRIIGCFPRAKVVMTRQQLQQCELTIITHAIEG